MKKRFDFRLIKAYYVLCSVLLLQVVNVSGYAQKSSGTGYKHAEPHVIASISSFDSLNNGRWVRTFQAPDGTLYLNGKYKSIDKGKSFIHQNEIDVDEIVRRPERASVSRGKLFYALNGTADIIRPGIYGVKAWRSTDGLKTMHEEYDTIYVPDGPVNGIKTDDWFGLFVYRTIIEIPDGTWLMTMYGNFTNDTIIPANLDAQKELKYMMRTFIVTSKDKGRTWHYLSTVATPRAGEPIGEGFVEPAITLLKDGRLLCVMRTGHHYPLYASWSNDLGKTWTAPLYTGFDRGCDPCLITLKDGRVALSWGRRFPEGWSKITREGDKSVFRFPGEGYTNLAISDNGGLSWVNHKVLKNSGTCYSTIIEVEPNIIFCQVDQWNMRIKLKPAKAITNN
ncbi:MAG: exo-alpha-sialidase [Chitinophagaceae bacterium]|nr:exo-alpha-sialidase [Chitinophagaceae bacterium]